jgi:hypothetical protein
MLNLVVRKVTGRLEKVNPDYSFGYRSMFLPFLVSKHLSSLFRLYEVENEHTFYNDVDLLKSKATIV